MCKLWLCCVFLSSDLDKVPAYLEYQGLDIPIHYGWFDTFAKYTQNYLANNLSTMNQPKAVVYSKQIGG